MQLTPAEKAKYIEFAELALPRHTSYPTVPHWQPWSTAEHEANLGRMPAGARLGLYVHVPFCRQLCFYCGCNREIVPDAKRAELDPAEAFLKGIEREARRVTRTTGRRVLDQLHLGGGTPTFLTPAQLARLAEIIARHYSLAPAAEVAAEIDPRVTTREHLATLRGLGYSRLSLGIQDFDPRVQAAINRVQSADLVRRVVDWARELGFASLNFDLIYGLPWQTEASMAATLAEVIRMAPDRIAFFRLAILPDLFRWQRGLTMADLPRGEASLALMLLAIQRFESAGYQFIGLDHFAKPHDALAQALAARDVSRTFQGMTTGRDIATIGLGPSAITEGGAFYAQSERTLADWLAGLETGLATVKGITLTADDLARRDVLRDLYAYGRVDAARFAATHGQRFWSYFESLRPTLAQLASAGLVTLDPESLAVTPTLGRLLVRVVAAVFDRSLPADAWRRGLIEGQASAAG